MSSVAVCQNDSVSGTNPLPDLLQIFNLTTYQKKEIEDNQYDFGRRWTTANRHVA